MNRFRILLLSIVLLFSQQAVFAQGDDSKDKLADAVFDYSISCYWRSFIVSKLMNFKLAPACWTKMLEKDGWGISTANGFTVNAGEFVKKQGWGDLEAAESANNNDRKNNKPQVEEMVNGLKDKFSFTLQADNLKCNDAEWNMVHRYWSTIGEFLQQYDWKPKGGAAFITLVVSPTAKDVSVVNNPDGKHFTVTCPADTEPEEWDGKIRKGLLKGGK